jgi:hypothetical protein
VEGRNPVSVAGPEVTPENGTGSSGAGAANAGFQAERLERIRISTQRLINGLESELEAGGGRARR